MDTVQRFGFEDDHLITIADADTALSVLEYFMAGHEVPWSFRKPFWYMPWTGFYPFFEKDGERSSKFWQHSGLRTSLSQLGQERLRSLTVDRLEHILYTRDKLLFYRLQRRAAKRRRAKNQDFSHEWGHLMGYYYLLLSGGLDQLALLTDEVLQLKVTPPVGINLRRRDFRSKAEKKNPRLSTVFNDAFHDWSTKLKLCRDFVAHRGTAHPVQLVNPATRELSEDEVDELARKRPEYRNFHLLQGRAFDAAFETLKQNVRISQIEVFRDDALVIDQPSGQSIVFPLSDIEWNYENYSRVLFAILAALEETT